MLDIVEHTGRLAQLAGLFRSSMGLEAEATSNNLMALEQARGTRYFIARRDGDSLGLLGLWFDLTGLQRDWDPPQIIDLGVRPQFRRQGVATALVRHAIAETRRVGFNRLWLFADGANSGVMAFYHSLGFRLAATVPDWYGDGTAKAILRLDLA